jgi:hypothetical protein
VQFGETAEPFFRRIDKALTVVVFGSTDLRPRAAESAAVAARWAVTEQCLCRTGFWSEVFELFLQWPCGSDPNGSLYVP